MTTKTTNTQTLLTIARLWAINNAGAFVDEVTDEVNLTELAEATADEFDHDEWLDDEFHPVWEWAIEASDARGEVI